MPRSRAPLLLLVTVVSALAAGVATSAGCGGGHHGSGSPTPSVSPPPGAVVEVEPNDVTQGETGTSLGGGPGTKTFWGVCADGNDVDGWTMVVGSGLVAAQITWFEDISHQDMDLYVYNSSGTIADGDANVPPNDSPAQVSAVFTTDAAASVNVTLEVDCLTSIPNVVYDGQVTLP